jgi:RNA polymerase sigma-70 factor (sigma-E family)
VELDFRGWASSRRGALRRTAFLLSGDWYLADDLVQEAFTRVFGVWQRVIRGGEPDAYARKVLLNLYLDHKRHPTRREEPLAEPPQGEAAEPEDLGTRDQLIAALRAVPPGQRAVLVLRFWEDLSVEQTAQVLNTSGGNVKSQTSRGLTALRAALAEQGLPDVLTRSSHE